MKRDPVHSNGSSPPARGTPRTRNRKRVRHRFIPARAGNTQDKESKESQTSVHPRPRGEHSGLSSRGHVFSGSSPPARGTRQARFQRYELRWFIPARAGNTWPISIPSRLPPVHPRPRGEHALIVWDKIHLVGSSPPARGTRIDPGFDATLKRFIPARAGNTARSLRTRGYPPVHPRPRGEHTTGHSITRYIAVHPRPRGEHLSASVPTACTIGSSPPARGTRTAARASA